LNFAIIEEVMQVMSFEKIVGRLDREVSFMDNPAILSNR
jgi:hypothetical protein